MDYDRRRHMRIAIPEKRLLECEGTSRLLQGQVSVLGLGGMFIRTQAQFPTGTTLGVRVRADGETLETECVVRDVLPNGLGVEFTRRDAQHEQSVKKLMFRYQN